MNDGFENHARGLIVNRIAFQIAFIMRSDDDIGIAGALTVERRAKARSKAENVFLGDVITENDVQRLFITRPLTDFGVIGIIKARRENVWFVTCVRRSIFGVIDGVQQIDFIDLNWIFDIKAKTFMKF